MPANLEELRQNIQREFENLDPAMCRRAIFSTLRRAEPNEQNPTRFQSKTLYNNTDS